MRVLLTGGSGQVGTEVRRRAAGFQLLAPGRAEFDLARPATLRPWLQRFRPELVLSVGAYTAVDRAEDESALAFSVNRDAIEVLAAYAQQAQAHLIHLSTDYVFDGKLERPYREDDLANPRGIYGASKLAGELAARSAERHSVLRVGWVFAAHGSNFVRTMLRLGATRDHLRVVSDQWGGPTWAGHIAEAMLALTGRLMDGQSVPTGTWHYGGVPHLNWHGFAQEILIRAQAAGLIDSLPQIEAIATAEYPTRAPRPGNSRLDSGRACAELGLTAPDWRVGLDAALRELAAG